MGIECRNFVNFRLSQPHLLGKRCNMGCRKMTVAVLHEVQVLNEQITATWPVAKQGTNVGQRLLVDLAALGHVSASPCTPLFPNALLIV